MDIKSDDPRLVFLRQASTGKLASILYESINEEVGMSFSYMSIGLNDLFKETTPELLRVLISIIIIERNGE